MASGEGRQTRQALSVAVGLWSALFGPFILGPGLPVYRDLLHTYVPLRQFWVERVSAGHLPGWFPYEGLGRPFIGQGITSTFHPVNLLYLVLDHPLALRLEIAGAVLVGILGQVLLARHLRLSAPAAVTGAMALVLNGYALSMTSNTAYLRGLCMLPWVALFAVRVLTDARPFAATAGLAVSWALIPLGGDAAATLLAALVVAAVTLAHGASRRAGWLALGAGLAGLLAAPELLPSSAQYADSIVAGFRDAGFLSSFWALHLERLPELLLAGISTPAPQVQTLQEPGRWAESVLLGVPLVALALSVPRQRVPLAFLALGALGVWLALGSHGGLEVTLRKLLPALNSVRYPEKHLALAAFGLATAVAFGVERARLAPRALLAPLGFAALLAFASWLKTPGEASAALLLAFAFAAGLAFVAWLTSRSPHAAWLLPLLLVGSLWRIPLGMITVPAEVLELPAKVPGSGRVWVERANPEVPSDAESMQRWAIGEAEVLSGDLGALAHRASFGATANLPLAPRQERRLLGWALSETRSLAPLFGYQLALQADGQQLVLPAAPRAWIASPRSVANPAALISRLRAEPAAAQTHPLVLGSLPAPLEGRVGEVSFVHDGVDALELEARLDAPGVLVLNELFDDGWSATVDGQAAPLLVVNALVRGVMLTPGTHRVAFTYEVPRLKAGLALGGTGWAGVLGLLLLWRLRRAPR